MKSKIYTTILLLALGFSLNAQNVAISNDNSTPDPSAMLEVKSSDKGMLIPRVILTNVNTALPVTDPAHGLFVFSESGAVPDGLYYWNDTDSKWIYVVTANDITNFGSGQIITTDERALVNSAVQTEVDPILTANITDYGSGQVITDAERTLVNSALQSENDPEVNMTTTNSVPKWDGSALVESTIEESATQVTINNTLAVDSLNVSGRITDKTGAIMPVGTVMPFAGPETAAPEGWLLCDGSILNKYDNPEYSDLFDVIANYWGGTSGADFKLPDLRGRFLRGQDAGSGNDPDKDSRTLIDGVTVVGDVVGSYQGHEFQSHRHEICKGTDAGTVVATSVVGAGYSGGTPWTTSMINSAGGNETRPKNAYVNYIIKY